MSEELKYDSPGERMDKVKEALKRKRSIQGIRSVVSEILGCGPADMQDFHFNVGNHKFRGIIYLKRNSLMGSLFYFWDNKIGVIKGYPKIKYSDDSRLMNKEVVCEEKVDGCNILVWRFPDGTLGGKTRLTPYWKGHKSYFFKDKTWEELLREADNGKTWLQIEKLLNDKNVIVCGELYGSDLPHDFVKYKAPPIGFKLFDIIDRDTNRFFPPLEALRLADKYQIPRVAVRWQGILTSKEVERIEFELSKSMDIEEGWVAKSYFLDEKDSYFAKLKTEAIKEKCWELTKSTIPMSIIKKAVHKVLENFPELKTIEEYLPKVREELLEDVEEILIEKSMDRIKESIRWTLTPSDADLYKLVLDKMKEMKDRGTDLSNKGHVLSNLSNALGTGISGGKLFMLYQQAFRELE